MDTTSGALCHQRVIKVHHLSVERDIFSESPVVRIHVDSVHIPFQKPFRLCFVFFEIASLFKSSNSAFMREHLEATVIDMRVCFAFPYVADCDAGVLLEFQIIQPLLVRIEAIVRLLKAPVRLFFVIKLQLLEILEAGLNGRHLIYFYLLFVLLREEAAGGRIGLYGRTWPSRNFEAALASYESSKMKVVVKLRDLWLLTL